jgi:S-adenosylmethionine decarboxylase
MTPSIIFTSHNQVADYTGSNKDLDYIDHEFSTNLDSTDAFEGPEKLLELWFSSSEENLPLNWPLNGLRDIPLFEIEKLLEIVNCQILSKISSKSMDAYLLSESSLFIYSNKLILKTCGTTTTLLCLDYLIKLITKYLDSNYNLEKFKSNIFRVFYSHRSFLFPERQNPIHQSWDSELNYLNHYFNESTHSTHILNANYNNNNNNDKTNEGEKQKEKEKEEEEESWHLYINGNINNIDENNNNNNNSNDITIEILMSDLDIKNAENFQLLTNKDKLQILDPKTEDLGHLLGNYMMNNCNLNKILKNQENINSIKHDAFAFTPCGFSSNSIINNNNYYTIHITPESGWSYASFETNYSPLDLNDMNKIVSNVVNSVKPGKFSLVICCEDQNKDKWNLPQNINNSEYILSSGGMIKVTTALGYDVIYGVYCLNK